MEGFEQDGYIENSNFNRTFFENLFVNGRESDGRAKRLGEAITRAWNRVRGAWEAFRETRAKVGAPRIFAR